MAMDRRHFVADCPGRLVPISTPRGKDWAFVPDELKKPFTFDPQLWPLLVEARTYLGTLNGIGQTLTEPKLLLRPLQNREAITSSRIEGTYVTPEQLLLFEMNPSASGKPSDSFDDWTEVHNYGNAIQKGVGLLNELPICNRLIREMHRVLMQGVRGKNKTPGEFRKHQVQLGHDGRFIPSPVGELDRLMADLEQYVNVPLDDLDPLVRCFVIHYQFEIIHPFLDGNGRIGRALLSLMIFTVLSHGMPWLYMSAFFDEYKDEYVDKLYRVSTKGEWSKWIEFCLRGVVQQAKDSIRRCDELNRLRKQYHERIVSPTARTHQFIESLFTDPFVQISNLAKKLGVTYPTAKSDVKLLENAGILQLLNGPWQKTYYCGEVFRVAYGEDEQKHSSDQQDRPNQ